MIYDIDFYIVLICFLVSSKYLELCLGGFTPIFDVFLVSSKYLELCLENGGVDFRQKSEIVEINSPSMYCQTMSSSDFDFLQINE
jgi:hypothetical protein